MTLLVTGADGQLGRALRVLAPDSKFTSRRELDLASDESVGSFDWVGVSAIINAAAYTAVDKAEDDIVGAWEVNATGVLRLARSARDHAIPLLQVSTDYVFGGGAEAPIAVGHPLAPTSVYGASKAAGELAAQSAGAAYIVRTGWVFGEGTNFVRTMQRLGSERTEVSVVADQHGRPTSALDLAAACLLLLREHPPGTYHASGQGDVASWADVAEAVLAKAGCQVRRVSSDEYASRAPRPRYSALEVSPEVVPVMRDWRVAVAAYVEGESQ